MPGSPSGFPFWLTEWMSARQITLWGAADVRDFPTPCDGTGRGFDIAIAYAVPMNPEIMITIHDGPNRAYADAYAEVNARIDETSVALAAEIRGRGYRAKSLAVSSRTDTIHIKGDFPHKTAATRSGLGWIGRHCQLITRRFGSWVRLGTVFTDMPLATGQPAVRSFCGHCRRCVEACPANALVGNDWAPGIPREKILDVRACDRWKKEHYFQYHNGHNCGICSAVCPYGLKFFKRRAKQQSTDVEK